MLHNIVYILIICIIIIVLFYIKICIKHHFWTKQPVFHVYNLSYLFRSPGIINNFLPEKNKYVNLKDITTLEFNNISKFKIDSFINLIKYNYLQNDDNKFIPSNNNIIPYFIGNYSLSFVSFFYKQDNLIDNKQQIITSNKLIGAITSRPLNVIINNKNNTTELYVNYIDYLCVHKLHRRQNIAPQLIQTHNYNQCHMNPKISISIFKREDELTGIVPICAYSTYGFHATNWVKPPELHNIYTILTINQHNIRLLYDFIRDNYHIFDIIISANLPNILELINTKNIFVNVILSNNTIIACYFYRKSCVQVETGIEALSCFASICQCNEDVFITGFKSSFWKIASENLFGFLVIENISHNNILISNITIKTPPTIISPTAYYFYNYISSTVQSNKALIIC